MKLAESLFGARIQLRIVWLEIPSSEAISEIGRPLVSVRSIIARRSSSVCRGLRIFESPSVRKTQAYEAHAGGARTPGSGRLRQGWLGSISTETLADAELFLGVYMPSERPGVVDHENELLNRRVILLQLGLSIVTPLYMRTKPYRVIGAQDQGRPVVRTCGYLPMIYATRGCNLNEFHVSEQTVDLGAGLADTLETVLFTHSYPRLRRAVESFLEGLRAPSIATRLHQFIRSIEGFMLPALKGTANDVGNKSQLFLEERYKTDLALI